MNEFTHSGRIIFEGGRQTEVLLKGSGLHWIDQNGHRWRVRTGEKAGTEKFKYPHLMTHSIRKLPKSKRTVHRLTHQGRVRGHYSKGRLVELRETPYYWIDAEGNRYKKRDNGWRVDGERFRVVLDSVVPLTAIHGVPIPPKRTAGTHEVIES